jgi:tetratricopeptide (TPR) repeat protein
VAASPARLVAGLLLALLTGCATTGVGVGVGGGVRLRQADEPFPPPARQVVDGAPRALVQEIIAHHQIAGAATGSGNRDQARAEWTSEAQALADFADRFPSDEWSLSFRYQAARSFLQAHQDARAQDQADQVLRRREASDVSRAMAAKLAHAAVHRMAQARVQAGQLEPLRLTPWEQRQAVPLRPRPATGAWQQLIDYADAYLKLADQDPDARKPTRERFLPATPAQVALSAAQASYAFDDMEGARARYRRLLETWPEEIDLGAVKAYRQTFLALDDRPGLEEALARLKARVGEAAARTTDAKVKGSLARVLEQLGQLDVDEGFNRAIRLFEAGQFAQAGAAFEAFLAATPASPGVPLALFNGALAFEKANQLEKSASLRLQLRARFPDSKEAEASLPMLAALRSRQGKKGEAVTLYRESLERSPGGPSRCSAAHNLGATLDELRRPVEAAGAYVMFGSDADCARSDPNAAARLLYRAGELLERAGKMADARQAYQACAQVAELTEARARSLQAEARKRARR